MEVTDTGAQSVYRLVPPLWVGFFNVLGEPIDNMGPVNNEETFPSTALPQSLPT